MKDWGPYWVQSTVTYHMLGDYQRRIAIADARVKDGDFPPEVQAFIEAGPVPHFHFDFSSLHPVAFCFKEPSVPFHGVVGLCFRRTHAITLECFRENCLGVSRIPMPVKLSPRPLSPNQVRL